MKFPNLFLSNYLRQLSFHQIYPHQIYFAHICPHEVCLRIYLCQMCFCFICNHQSNMPAAICFCQTYFCQTYLHQIHVPCQPLTISRVSCGTAQTPLADWVWQQVFACIGRHGRCVVAVVAVFATAILRGTRCALWILAASVRLCRSYTYCLYLLCVAKFHYQFVCKQFCLYIYLFFLSNLLLSNDYTRPNIFLPNCSRPIFCSHFLF